MEIGGTWRVVAAFQSPPGCVCTDHTEITPRWVLPADGGRVWRRTMVMRRKEGCAPGLCHPFTIEMFGSDMPGLLGKAA